MTAIYRALLDAWPKLGQHPDLIAVLARTTGDTIDPKEAVKALLLGIAVPRRTDQVLSALLAAGEFGAAERALETSQARQEMPLDQHTALEETLDLARRRAREDLQVRAATLQARSQRVGLTFVRPPELEEAVADRRALGETLLDRWESRVLEAEERLASQIRVSLSQVLPEAGPAETAWKKAVEDCIEAQEYEAARFLIDGGPVAPVPEEAQSVPRISEWPWADSLSEVLGWANATRPAPAEFNSRWRHRQDDKVVHTLVKTLLGIVEASVVDRKSAEEFANVFDEFLGCEGAGSRQVAEGAGGFEIRTHALDDIRLPKLRISGSDGVPLWIAQSPDASPRGDDPVVVFHPWRALSVPDGVLAFDTRSLLRLLSEREYRRVNLLRELGSRCKLSAAIPLDLDGLRLPPMGRGEQRAYVNWLLDILNVQAEEPVFADVMIHYSGAQLRLALHLMRVLLGGVTGRRTPVTSLDLARAWESDTFRALALSELLTPIDSDPAARAVLGAALLNAGHPGGEVALGDVVFALDSFWGRTLAADRVKASLDRLNELRLIEPLGRDAFRLPRSGVSTILLDGIADVEEYVRKALEEERDGP